jgi:hypothetical protein
MTLKKFRLAYLLVVVLSVATVYAIADFNQGTPLELSDAQMQQLSGRGHTQRAVCIVAVTGTNCPTSCVPKNSILIPNGVEMSLRNWRNVNFVRRGTYFGQGYGCDITGNPSDWCNTSSLETFCTYELFAVEECEVVVDEYHSDFPLECEP